MFNRLQHSAIFWSNIKSVLILQGIIKTYLRVFDTVLIVEAQNIAWNCIILHYPYEN